MTINYKANGEERMDTGCVKIIISKLPRLTEKRIWRVFAWNFNKYFPDA